MRDDLIRGFTLRTETNQPLSARRSSIRNHMGFHTLEKNISWFSGFAKLYHENRPSPPDILHELASRFSGFKDFDLVVDLGSGTGLSARYWSDYSKRVVGVEPNDDMRRAAESLSSAPHISYTSGLGHSTGLPTACAQLVQCFQSLHWMNPKMTFREIHRILIPGGLFLVADYDWPPVTGSWEIDAAWKTCIEVVRHSERRLGVKTGLKQWDQKGHLERMQSSGLFRHIKEIVLHQVDRGDYRRLVGALLSQAGTAAVMKRGITERDLGIDEFRELAKDRLGDGSIEWYWSSRVRAAIK